MPPPIVRTHGRDVAPDGIGGCIFTIQVQQALLDKMSDQIDVSVVASGAGQITWPQTKIGRGFSNEPSAKRASVGSVGSAVAVAACR
jgi:hypothetical protein